eukprot:4676159-Prymnesium_polylepis.2
MAAARGGAAGGGFAAQALQPSFGAHVDQIAPRSGLRLERLVAVDETLAALAAAGWRQPSVLHAADFERMYGRRPHEGFCIVTADADTP